MRPDLKKRLMNVAGIFVNSGSWATIPIGDEVKLEFGKQPEVTARVEIEMGITRFMTYPLWS